MAKVQMTKKQKKFADEYLVDLNGTQAAVRAGYSPKSAARYSVDLLNLPHVAQYIQKRQQDASKRTEITQDRVLREIAAIAFAKLTDHAQVTRRGKVVITPTEDLTEEQKAAVVTIKETQAGTEIKLADKLKALQLLGDHLGIFDAKSEEKTEDLDDGLLDALNGTTREDWKEGEDEPE